MTFRLSFLTRDGQVHSRLLYSADGALLARGAEALAYIAGSSDPVRDIVAVPVAEMQVLRLKVPGLSLAQDLAAARLGLAGQLAEPLESLHLALGTPLTPRSDGQKDGWAAVVSRTQMESWLRALGEKGITPAAMVPDAALFLPLLDQAESHDPAGIEAGAEPARVIGLNGLALVLTEARLFAAEPLLVPAILGGQPHTVMTDADAVESAIGRTLADRLSRGQGLNLLSGDYAPKTPRAVSTRQWLQLGIVAALVIALVPALLIGAQGLKSMTARADLERKTADLAKSALPDAARIVKPLAQVRERDQELSGQSRQYAALATLYTAMNDIPSARLSAIVLSGTGDVFVTLRHDNHSDADTLTAALEARGLALTRNGSNEGDGGLSTDLILHPSARGGQ